MARAQALLHRCRDAGGMGIDDSLHPRLQVSRHSIAAKQAALTQSTQSKTRMISQTIFAPDLARRLKSDPLLKDLAF
jgi:hypothetical protein